MKKLVVVIVILFASCSSSDDDCLGTLAEINQKYNAMIEKSSDEEQQKRLMAEREEALLNACD